METPTCPCHRDAAAHEAFVTRFVATLLDGSRYAGLAEDDEDDAGEYDDFSAICGGEVA